MRTFVWRILKRWVFLLDAEMVHERAIRFLKIGILLGNVPLRVASGHDERKLKGNRPEVLGMKFASRLGLAAGFDKNAEVVRALPALGFGFAEIGTVTPRPQPGNPKPRLYRDPATSSIFNRMGFNGAGAEVAARNLIQARAKLPEFFRVGVNIGKNKDTALSDAAADYERAVSYFEGLADFIVINVSSPNTPGLRSLQTVEALKPIVGGVHNRISKWGRRPPLLLKLAPEVRGTDLAELISSCEALGIDGWVLTNTLAGRWERGLTIEGGWSGGLLTQPSYDRLLEARALTAKPIISVGGIGSPEEALRRRQAGADLVQFYTGWIFGGPALPAKVADTLSVT